MIWNYNIMCTQASDKPIDRFSRWVFVWSDDVVYHVARGLCGYRTTRFYDGDLRHQYVREKRTEHLES